MKLLTWAGFIALVSYQSFYQLQVNGQRLYGKQYCSRRQRECSDRTCIDPSQVCDGNKDCNDDESAFNCIGCNTSTLRIPNSTYDGCLTDKLVSHMATISVECDTGYFTFRGHSGGNITCRNGEWLNIPTCDPGCSRSRFPSNVTLSIPMTSTYLTSPRDGRQFQIHDSIILTCAEGFFVIDDQIKTHIFATCSGPNTWDPPFGECVPKEHFVHVYKPNKEVHLEVEFGGSATLECEFVIVENQTEEFSFLWLKDDIEVKSTLNNTILIQSNGSLSLTEISSTAAGRYFCLIKINSRFIPSATAYTVKLATACVPLPTNSSMVVNESSSTLIFCPDTRSQTLFPSVWYDKNNRRIWNNEKYTIISERSLLIKNVEADDEGPIVCDMGTTSPFCKSRFTTFLEVISSKESLCGKSTNSNSPWHVSLWWNDETAPFCYGVLVNEHWVLTAASCLIGVHRKRNPDVFVKLGRNHSLGTKAKGQTTETIPVEYAKIHPKYSRRINFADIGVVKLKYPATFSKEIIPICISDQGLTAELRGREPCKKPKIIQGEVSGSGSLEGELQLPDTESMEIPEDTNTCSSLPDGVFCAQGTSNVYKNVADTGSPFQVLYNGRMYLYGIYSWGERRSGVGNFDYFVNVTNYDRWIALYINKKEED